MNSEKIKEQMPKLLEALKDDGIKQFEVAKRLGVTEAAVSGWRTGRRNISESALKSICREFNVDYIWLTTGEGEMFRKTDPEDEIAICVSQLIDEKDNPFFNIVLEATRTYNQLTPENQEVLSHYCKELLRNLQSKKES